MNRIRTITNIAATGGATALVALGLGACKGAGEGSAAASDPREKAQEGALKFARCMRGEGIDMPDPQISGDGMIKVRRQGPATGPAVGARRAAPVEDPRFRAAMQKCRTHLRLGGGERPSPAQQAKFRDAFLKFARCMRANGVNIPDPQPGGDAGFVMRAGGPGKSGVSPESPKFQAAERKCRGALDEVRPEVAR